MEFKREIIIDKPILEVWEIVGNQFGEAYKWASGINHSSSFGKPVIEGATCNNRSCELPSGKITEKVRIFNEEDYILEYEVIQGFPFFVESGINNWTLTTHGDKTKVNMHLNIQTTGIVGRIMNPMMRMQMNNATKSVLSDLKHYAETGLPSQKKQQELSKTSRKSA